MAAMTMARLCRLSEAAVSAGLPAKRAVKIASRQPSCPSRPLQVDWPKRRTVWDFSAVTSAKGMVFPSQLSVPRLPRICQQASQLVGQPMADQDPR